MPVNLAASSFATTGSISASSNSLTVADASGFAINDYLIIEIGGESGAGARGTIGVGGAWPDLSYANAAAMNADTGQADGQYAYLIDTGNVYRSFSGLWEQQTFYYWAKVIPRGLAARVTAKAGNVLTLDASAVVSTTNANVYFDNFHLADAHTADPDGTEIIWPTGNYAMSAMWWITDRSNWYIHGTSKTATKLFFPKGISDYGLIHFSGSGSGNRVSDICVQGNALAQGYMVAWEPGFSGTVTHLESGITFSANSNSTISDTKSIDVFQSGAGCTFCVNTSVYRHDAVLTEGLLGYTQWQIQGADCTGGSFIDCTVTSTKLTAGIEWFRSTGNIIRGYVGVNAVMSLNSADSWQVINPTVTIQANSQISQESFGRDTAIIAITDTIGGISIANGGVLTNPTIVVQGYINADNDVLLGISVASAAVVNIRVAGGSYTGPDYAAPSTLFGPAGLRSDGVNTQVSCFTVYGQIQAGTPTVIRSNIGVAHGSISYCRALSIFPASTTADVTVIGNGLPTDPLNTYCIGGSQTVKVFHSSNSMVIKKGRR